MGLATLEGLLPLQPEPVADALSEILLLVDAAPPSSPQVLSRLIDFVEELTLHLPTESTLILINKVSKSAC